MVAYYSGRFDAAMGAFVPDVVQRYSIWIAIATLLQLSVQTILFRETKNVSARHFQIAIFALIINVLVATRCLQFPYCVDDTYIVFRYAENIFNHGVPDYEFGGEHVNAISSQLHLISLLFASLLSGSRNFPLVAQSMNMAFDLASILMLFLFLRRLLSSTWIAIYGCAIWTTSIFGVFSVCHGKETSLTMLCLFIFLWASVCERFRIRAWAAAMCMLARPEGLFIFLTTMVADFFTPSMSRTETLKRWLAPCAMVGTVFAFVFFYYGTVIPQGILVKSIVYHFTSIKGGWNIAHALSFSFTGPLKPASDAEGILWTLGVHALAIGLLWRYKSLRIYLVALLMVATAFTMGNALVWVFLWYYSWWAPLPPIVFAVLIKRISELKSRLLNTLAVERETATSVSTKGGTPEKTAPISAVSAILTLVVVGESLLYVPFYSYPRTEIAGQLYPLPIFYWDNLYDRMRIYEVAGEYMNKVVPPGETAAFCELGIAGWAFRGKAFDLQGMVSKEAIKYYPVPPEENPKNVHLTIPSRLVRDFKFNRIICVDGWIEDSLWKDKYFLDNYELEGFWPNDCFESVGFYLYKRKVAGSGNNYPPVTSGK